jgi:tyrosinase
MRALSPDVDELSRRFWEAVAVRGFDFTESDLASFRQITDTWSDPASWGYQAQVHGTCDPRRDRFPSRDGVVAIWDECAHEHWFFLPWHRAYLLEFESVVRQHIEALGGPAETWALPYWEYTDHPGVARAAELPRPLSDATLPDGVEVPGVEEVGGMRPNPLFDPTPLPPARTSESGGQ